jgi:predicted Mrr-cat superfamily restriction endonuclease
MEVPVGVNGERDAKPSAWLVRSGEDGVFEDSALADGLIIAGWYALSDIGGCRNRDDIWHALRDAYPEQTRKVISNWTGQLWRFMAEIEVGDRGLTTRPLFTDGAVEDEIEIVPADYLAYHVLESAAENVPH